MFPDSFYICLVILPVKDTVCVIISAALYVEVPLFPHLGSQGSSRDKGWVKVVISLLQERRKSAYYGHAIFCRNVLRKRCFGESVPDRYRI
jgi:hypothetical protein